MEKLNWSGYRVWNLVGDRGANRVWGWVSGRVRDRVDGRVWIRVRGRVRRAHEAT